jgi:hypothetical protein
MEAMLTECVSLNNPEHSEQIRRSVSPISLGLYKTKCNSLITASLPHHHHHRETQDDAFPQLEGHC